MKFALIVTMRDEAALHAYDTHPIHQELVTNLARPLVDRIVVYDFYQQTY